MQVLTKGFVWNVWIYVMKMSRIWNWNLFVGVIVIVISLWFTRFVDKRVPLVMTISRDTGIPSTNLAKPFKIQNIPPKPLPKDHWNLKNSNLWRLTIWHFVFPNPPKTLPIVFFRKYGVSLPFEGTLTIVSLRDIQTWKNFGVTYRIPPWRGAHSLQP